MDTSAEQGELLSRGTVAARKRPPPSKKANDLSGKAWLQNSISVWSDIAKTPEEVALKHPAMFPTQLVCRLIESFTHSGQTAVLDPFCGIGSSVLAAEAMGKTGIGLDISAEYLSKAERRPALSPGLFEGNTAMGAGERRFIEADARDLPQYVAPASIDFVVTSPPYWDILLRNRTADYKEIRNYGDSDSDLGRIADYGAFLDALGSVFSNVFTVLRPGCYCCVVVMDLRKGSRFFPLHADLATKMQDIGFLFDDIIIWDRRREYNNLRPLGHPSVFRINKVHEYVLIFQKPRYDAD